MELYHQFLLVLHHSETVLLHSVCVVEEEIVLRSQLNAHILNVVVVITLLAFA